MSSSLSFFLLLSLSLVLCLPFISAQADYCSLFQSCSGCVDNFGCGYCDTTGICSSGNVLGPSNGTCSNGDWYYGAGSCAVVPPDFSYPTASIVAAILTSTVIGLWLSFTVIVAAMRRCRPAWGLYAHNGVQRDFNTPLLKSCAFALSFVAFAIKLSALCIDRWDYMSISFQNADYYYGIFRIAYSSPQGSGTTSYISCDDDGLSATGTGECMTERASQYSTFIMTLVSCAASLFIAIVAIRQFKTPSNMNFMYNYIAAAISVISSVCAVSCYALGFHIVLQQTLHDVSFSYVLYVYISWFMVAGSAVFDAILFALYRRAVQHTTCDEYAGANYTIMTTPANASAPALYPNGYSQQQQPVNYQYPTQNVPRF